MSPAMGMMCISKSPQLFFSKLYNTGSSCGDKQWLRWKCLTADVTDGNDALTHVKDHHVKEPPDRAVRGLYIPATSITPSLSLSLHADPFLSPCLTPTFILYLSQQTL